MKLEPSEKEIENSILEYLNFQQNTFAFKVNTMGVYDAKLECYRKLSRYIQPGCADIICIFKGKALFFEVKSAKGHLSANQKVFCDSVKRAGGGYFVLRSVEDAKTVLQVLGQQL